MQWSKTKAMLESFLCDKLKERVKIYATVYRRAHDGISRVWITLDGEELVSAADNRFSYKHGELYDRVKKENQLNPIPYDEDWANMFQSVERAHLSAAFDDAEDILKSQGIFPSYYFYEAFMKYSSLSIDEALQSQHIIIRAFAMFDRRLGKRRLVDMALSEESHPLILKFYSIRLQVEGLL